MTIEFPPLYGSDFVSAGLVTAAFFQLPEPEKILCSGFNTQSGYVYIALENGVTIASCFGRRVEYIVTNPDTGKETFFSTYPMKIS